MNWLESHAYLAAWLGLPVSIGVTLFQNVKTNFEKLDWSRSLIGFAFLTALAVRFSPGFDAEAKATANYIILFGLAFLIVDRKSRT